MKAEQFEYMIIRVSLLRYSVVIMQFSVKLSLSESSYIYGFTQAFTPNRQVARLDKA